MAGNYMESKIGRIAVVSQSAWGTAESVPIADTGTVECEISYPTTEQEALVQESLKGNWHADTVVAGAKRATLSLSMVLHGWDTTGATITTDPTVTLNPEMLLLKSALGGLVATGYTNTVTGGTASVATNSATASGWVGNAQLYDLGSSDYSVGWVKSSTGTDVTFIRDLSAAPDGSATVAWGSATAYLTKSAMSPLTIFYQGPDTGAAGNGATLRLSDCVVTSATITINPKEQPKLSCEISCGNWDITGSGLTDFFDYSYTQMNPLIGVNGARFVTAAGETPAFSGEFSIENTVAEVTSLGSTQGLAECGSTSRTVTGTLVLPASNSFTLKSPGQALGVVQVDLASSPGQSFSILVPTATVSEMETIGDRDGIIAINNTSVTSKYTSDAADDDAGNSAFRIAWL